MKKLAILCMGLSVVFLFSACKSKESAYKKIYEKAKQQELAEPEVISPVESSEPVETPVVEAPVEKPVSTAPIREEKVTVVTGAENGLKNYSVVCGSFSLKTNAERLKSDMDNQGYNAIIVYNAEKAMYRVVVATFDDRDSAARARDEFKAKYPDREDFQGAWLLYRVY